MLVLRVRVELTWPVLQTGALTTLATSASHLILPRARLLGQVADGGKRKRERKD